MFSLSLSWSRSPVSDLAKLRVLDAAVPVCSRSDCPEVGFCILILYLVQIIKRLVSGEPCDELRMLLVAAGSILFGRVELIHAFKQRVNIFSIVGSLAPTWPEAIREVASELVEICKS
jgi:hypothetical protein